MLSGAFIVSHTLISLSVVCHIRPPFLLVDWNCMSSGPLIHAIKDSCNKGVINRHANDEGADESTNAEARCFDFTRSNDTQSIEAEHRAECGI